MSEIHLRHIRNAIDADFDGRIDMSDYDNANEEERRKAFLSRGLAAYSVLRLADTSPEQAAESVTDGGDDNGLDAVFVDLPRHSVTVVQSKWSNDGGGSANAGEVHKFKQGFEDLINGRFDRFNAKVRGKEDGIVAALDDPKVTFRIVFAHSGQDNLAEVVRQILDDLVDDVNDTTEVASYVYLNQGRLHELVAGAVAGEDIELEVALSDYGLIDEPFSAYYGKVEAADVANWWGEHGTKLFAQNLRELIPDSEVNESITQTLIGSPENFWYFNNGITALAKTVERKPMGAGDRRTGVFVCAGVSIVNGAQTVGSIGTAHSRDPDAVARARVTVRFISLEGCPPDFASAVTKATNTQNRIERRDFVSLDPEQLRLRIEMGLDGKQYAIKTGEAEPAPEDGCSVVDATIALACAANDVGLAVQAKREIGRLWEDINKPPYKAIFNPSVNSAKLWRCVETMRAVDGVLLEERTQREGRARSVVVHGNRLILHLVFSELPVDRYASPDWDFGPTLAGVPDLTYSVLDALVRVVEDEFPNNYVASLFKNASRCRTLASKIK